MTEEKRSAGTARPNPPFKPWVVSTYFAEGFPYSIVRMLSTVFFTDAGASLQAIGLTSLYGLPWNLKFLWAPLFDAFSTKRRWLLALEVVLAATVACIALVSAFPDTVAAVAVLFLVLAFFSANHDIAIDGNYLALLDKKQQARYVGYQAMSYRIAMVSGGTGILLFSSYTSWTAAFLLAAAVLAGLSLFHLLAVPPSEKPARPGRELGAYLLSRQVLFVFLLAAVLLWARSRLVRGPASHPAVEGIRWVLGIFSPAEWIILIFSTAILVMLLFLRQLKRRIENSDSFYARAFVDYLDQPSIGIILGFVLLYRTGESNILNMLYPFLSRIGVTRADYGIGYSFFGVIASIIGAMLGGHLISRYGLKRVVWPLVLAQNLPNLLYMVLAFLYRDLLASSGTGFADLSLVFGFIYLESFGAGLGTSVFMVFIMRTCKPAFKAAHFAIATSIMSLSATFAGIYSGVLADLLGFPVYFGLTFLATLPGMGLIFFLPYLDGSSAADLAPKEGGD